MQHIEKNELISHFVLTLPCKYQNHVAFSENLNFNTSIENFFGIVKKIFDLIASNTFLDMFNH